MAVALYAFMRVPIAWELIAPDASSYRKTQTGRATLRVYMWRSERLTYTPHCIGFLAAYDSTVYIDSPVGVARSVFNQCVARASSDSATFVSRRPPTKFGWASARLGF